MNFRERYQFDREKDLLGRGGFSTVFLGTDTLLDRKVAIKFFSNVHDDKYSVIAEIKKVIKLEHPNIARYFDAQILETESVYGGVDKVEVGVMELLDGGDLKTFLKKETTNAQVRDKLLTDVLRGLSYLHRRKIIHRDLKPQNILIKNTEDGPVAKIMDFGISKIGGSNTSSALLGSIEYMAPEQFNPAKYGVDGKMDANVDLWSYGVMAYELLRGSSLFGARTTGHTSEQVMSNILQKNIEEDLVNVEQPWRGVIERCLVKDAAQRAQTADELLDLYANPQETKTDEQQPIPTKVDTPPEVEKRIPPVSESTNVETQVLKKSSPRPVSTVKTFSDVNPKVSEPKPLSNRTIEENQPHVQKQEGPVKKLLPVLITIPLVLGFFYLGYNFLFTPNKAPERTRYHLILASGDSLYDLGQHTKAKIYYDSAAYICYDCDELNAILAKSSQITPPPPAPAPGREIEIAEDDVEIMDVEDLEIFEPEIDTKDQDEESKKSNDPDFFTVVEDMPVYPGGDAALLGFIGKSTKYPSIAKENGVTGVVYVSYIVDIDGSIKEVKVVRGADPYLDKEAVRVVKSIRGYTPGRAGGKLVPVQFTIPIRFQLSSGTENNSGNDSQSESSDKLTMVTGRLGGRVITILPKIRNVTGKSGKVVVEITVDRLGKVIKATPGGRGSTTSDRGLEKLATEAAYNTKFNSKADASIQQKGQLDVSFD